MRLSAATFLLSLLLSIPLATPAQSANGSSSAAPAADRPGRDPKQPIDEEYTKKILEYTTEKFFLSPLVDYLPASRTVPTPKVVLGDIAGAPNKLPYSKEVYDYMRRLDAASPRVRVYTIGQTEEGRDMIAVAVASEALMNRLDENKANLAKLADPRTINMNDAEAARLAATTAPVYYITGTIHSPEAGAPTALMELAYRLAVDESPYIKHIRDNLITLITPIVEVDGRDRQVDIFNWHMKYPDRTWPGLIYWGKYVAHDNNRDAMGVTLKLTENVLNAYVDWKAQVLHDLHESVPYLYDNTIGDGPYNAWVDPLLTNEWHMIGWNNVQEMTRLGMPGVFAFGAFDTWSPGYLMFIAATHNGISRLYETFGNGGSAETLERTLSESQTSRTWYRQNPPLPRVKWSLRNNNNYEQTGVLVSLNYFATNKRLFLQNFYEKSKRSILKAKTEGPAAYVLPATDPRLGAQSELLRVLQKQRVEISKATAPFTVEVRRPGPRPQAPGPRDSTAQRTDSTATRVNRREFPTGSYIIKMDQPYSRIADALLDYQYWAPNDPQTNPYDDTGWTFPEGFATQAVRITDTTVLKVPVQAVTGAIIAPGGVTGSGEIFLINANADNALVTLRYRLKQADVQAAEEPFQSGGQRYARGSFIIRGVASNIMDATAKELGLKVAATASAPSVKAHPVRAARIAIMHTWASTQTEGWWRLAFDQAQVPFEYISTQEASRDENLRAKYDVILFPPGGGNPQSIVQGMPMWRNPMPWKNSPETPNISTLAQTDDIRPGLGWSGVANLEAFVKQGGVLVTSENTSNFAITFGYTSGVTMNTPTGNAVVGSFLRSRLVDDASPIAYGVRDSIAVYSSSGESFSVGTSRGGGRGGGGGPAQRATGRGTPDDADAVQGRPALEDRFMLPPRVTVQPWQLGPVTDDMLRNATQLIPPEQRPRVVMRFSDQRDLLVSGLLSGGGTIAQRPLVVDVPFERGHVVLFANNPVWRGYTLGTYGLVFNTIMHFDNLNAGRKLDEK
jgi:hypothetical protein